MKASILMLLLIFLSVMTLNVRSSKPPAPNGVKSMTTYESRIGEQGLLLEDENLQMWIPAAYEPHSKIIFSYLEAGYANLSNIFGDCGYPYKFSIEHYPEGSPYFWGGTDAQGTIRYGYGNLKDDTPEWNQYRVPHVIGYYEEMAHCFANHLGIRGEYSVGFYETLGYIIGGETTLRAAWNTYIQNLIHERFRTCAATTAYYLEHNTGEPGVPENIYLTRILAHIFKTKVIDPYGWEALTKTFKALQEGFPLRLYDRDHTWGGFLGLLTKVVNTDMHGVFESYGLPALKWTGETGFESDGVESLNSTNRYRFRIKVVDREGSQPTDVKVHLYYEPSSPGVSYGMNLAEGNASVGWIYEKEIALSDSYGWTYAFSANDGVHPVFQAVGQPTEKQQLSLKKPTLLSIEAVSSNASNRNNITLRGELCEKDFEQNALWEIGIADDSSIEFDQDPHDDPPTIMFNINETYSNFPSGLGTDIGSQRSKIVINFVSSITDNIVFTIRWNPGGSTAIDQFSVSLDGELLGVSEAVKGSDHPYEWRIEKFQKSLMLSGDHNLTLTHLRGDGLNFDFLSLHSYEKVHIAGQLIYIECYETLEWKSIGNTTTSNNGTYIFIWQPKFAGTYTIRAQYKGNATYVESISENVTVSIVLALETDLNGDGKVNIIDITIVAKAFQAKYNETDEKYWHEPPCKYCPHAKEADLNDDEVINIVDIAIIARDFGKTV